jgi:hypothetical protein
MHCSSIHPIELHAVPCVAVDHVLKSFVLPLFSVICSIHPIELHPPFSVVPESQHFGSTKYFRKRHVSKARWGRCSLFSEMQSSESCLQRTGPIIGQNWSVGCSFGKGYDGENYETWTKTAVNDDPTTVAIWWNKRNSFRKESKWRTTVQVAFVVAALADQFQTKRTEPLLSDSCQTSKWSRPETGVLKMNSDRWQILQL